MRDGRGAGSEGTRRDEEGVIRRNEATRACCDGSSDQTCRRRHAKARMCSKRLLPRLHGRPSSRGRAVGVPAATCYMLHGRRRGRQGGTGTGSRAPRTIGRDHPGREGMQTIRWQLVTPYTYLPYVCMYVWMDVCMYVHRYLDTCLCMVYTTRPRHTNCRNRQQNRRRTTTLGRAGARDRRTEVGEGGGGGGRRAGGQAGVLFANPPVRCDKAAAPHGPSM
jgi:hypothetical protein